MIKLLVLLVRVLWYTFYKHITDVNLDWTWFQSVNERKALDTWRGCQELHTQMLQKIREQGRAIETAPDDKTKQEEIAYMADLEKTRVALARQIKSLRKFYKRNGFSHLLEN